MRVLSLLLFCFLCACKNTQEAPQSDLNTIEFKHQGAALAPQYHRSYSISISAQQATLAIKDYSKTLKTDVVNMNATQWQQLSAIAQKFSKDLRQVAQGATGTSVNSIVINAQNKAPVQLIFDSMQTPTGDLKALHESILALFPTLEQQLQATRTN
jgi:hypothetical protein